MGAVFVHAPVAAAARAANAERKLIAHLRGAKAVSATAATALPAIDGLDDKLLDRLLRSGVLGRSSGRYYVDQAVLEHRAQSRKLAGLVALVIAAAGAAVALIVLATRG